MTKINIENDKNQETQTLKIKHCCQFIVNYKNFAKFGLYDEFMFYNYEK